tara:strand:+ start:1663 stop:2811 length:1149 start_codon:yes stop_codon:yes gene_type:complete
MKIRIRKPDDSGEYWTTSINFVDHKLYERTVDIRGDVQKKDPIHSALVTALRGSFKNSRRTRRFFNGLPSTNNTLMIGDTPFHIKKTSRYYINGKLMTLDEMCNALARVLFKSCFEKDPAKLLPYLYSTLEVPESIKYVIENRLPYFFYSDFSRHEVRLNVKRISDNECAIEIGDGIWGSISFKDLDNYCRFYVEGKKRSKWAYISPQNLYQKVMGRKPLGSDLKVLVAFLKQNRKQDIVEKRAIELVEDMLKQYPDRLKAVFSETGVLTELLVKGKKYDWKLKYSGGSSRSQAVSTYVWQPEKEQILDDEGNKTGEFRFVHPSWRGPICIDNMGESTPIGDQFAGRALALLNDVFTIKIVSTIGSYIVDRENDNRVDWNEM